MPSETPPPSPEQESISDARCLEAMKAGDFETVRTWYAEQEQVNDASADQRSRLDFQLHYARLQYESGLIDEDTGESYAIPTLEALRDTYPAEGDETAHYIQELIDRMRQA